MRSRGLDDWMSMSNLKGLGCPAQKSFCGLALIAFALSGFCIPRGFYPYIFRDIVIEAPPAVSVGQRFTLSGTSYHSAAERVLLYCTDSREPIGFTVVSTRRPYDFQFEISVASDGLSLDGSRFYVGRTEGRTFHFYVQSNQQRFNISPIVAVTVEG
ncbi:hypothetical protein KEJ39_08015 [Candidatus Bathyarchaeota archaeon]|nr:hypothetical protein [Candidatus Bathyarchaeota archaeon]